MTREERELRSQIATLKNEARTLVSEDKMDEAKAKAAEAQSLTDKADLLAKLEDDGSGDSLPRGEAKDKAEQMNVYKSGFLNAIRGRTLSDSERDAIKLLNTVVPMSGGAEATGGLLVPQDLQTAINQYKRTLPQLEPLINVIPVSTLSGQRVFETIAAMTALANISDETADIDEMAPPTFEKVTYSIKDYAGWMPVPNDLLNDSDQNIEAYLAQWIGRKSVVTRNSLILAIFNALIPATWTDYNGIKKALNITLDPMIAANAIIMTNQDGFQYLDTLEDGNGRPILQVDVTQPSQKLFAGKPVKVIGNSALASAAGDVAPFFVGDPRELVAMFERKGHEIASTNIGGTAFRKNRTELRVIEREDVKAVDTSSVVFGKIDVTAAL